MKTITVQVREDHLETLARTKPMAAMAELIWNALDAEATEVRVEFLENDLEGLEAIRIVDNGHGLHYDDAFIVFQNLGGSWKREGMRTLKRKRMLHGKFGKGRFRAFTLGNRIEWQSVYDEDGALHSYSIIGRATVIGQFDISTAKPAAEKHTGMVLEIANPPASADVVRGVKALEEITDIFALYMRQYPDVRIVYDNVPLDPANAEARFTEYVLDNLITQDGEKVKAILDVVEWTMPGKRGVFLCDEFGFMRSCALSRLHFRGFSYTAYLKSAHVGKLDAEGLLAAQDLVPDVLLLVDAARAKLREHFTLREAEHAQDTIVEWRDQGLYPYEGDPADENESNERRIFDIYATHLNQIFPDFATSSSRNRRLILRLVRELVHAEPTRMARILDELIEFPEEKEGEVLEILGV